MTSLFGFSGEPRHVAMIARLDEVGQSLARFRAETCWTEPDRIETDPQCSVSDLVS
jgi:hypothetical protein